jgi:glycosyltransferase involved in cell wall biosynthesis
MRILVATDASPPQVNGVVRSLQSLAASARKLGAEVEFLTPEGFRSFPLPTYPSIRCAIPTWREIGRRIELSAPDCLPIATEGPIGQMVRRYCLARKISFTTSFMTRFPEYVSARLPVPQSWTYALLRRFHAAAAVTMVSTRSLIEELGNRGFTNLAMWTRGVDTDLFKPERTAAIDLPRPIFVSVGRLAVEKNLAAFLALDLPGSKVVIGEGPQANELKHRFPNAHFLGQLEGETLAAHLAAADVFVFPSRTDTFGVVQLEALACGVRSPHIPFRGHRT